MSVLTLIVELVSVLTFIADKIVSIGFGIDLLRASVRFDIES